MSPAQVEHMEVVRRSKSIDGPGTQLLTVPPNIPQGGQDHQFAAGDTDLRSFLSHGTNPRHRRLKDQLGEAPLASGPSLPLVAKGKKLFRQRPLPKVVHTGTAATSL